MKTATVRELKIALAHCSHTEILELCLRLSKFKKENKELLTYLLFESDNEEAYINTVKSEIDQQFELINTKTYYFIKKSIRKILRNTKKYIKYSQNKETEVELLLYFCQKLNEFILSIKSNSVLLTIKARELEAIKKKVLLLHEDLQYDYNLRIEELTRI